MDNKRAADTLSLLGDLIELAEDAAFKARAYHSASRTLKRLEQPASELVAQGTLGSLPGFGKALVEKVEELYETGKIAYLEDLKATLPPGVIQMRKISGLGAKKIKLLFRDQGIDSLSALSKAAEDGSLESMPGFGAKSVLKVVEGISQVQSFEGKLRLPDAIQISEAVLDILADQYGRTNTSIAGEVRRCMPVIETLHWVVAGAPDVQSLARSLKETTECESCKSERAGTIQLSFPDSVSGTIRFVSKTEFGRTVLCDTGPEAFTTQVLSAVKETGLSEADYISRAGMGDIPPECRDYEPLWIPESSASLLKYDQIRGVLHCHTDYSDGSATLEEMANAARARGLTYLGICDHSPSAAYAGGLTPDRVALQQAEIDRLNAGFDDGFRILKGTESDIRADGSLDFPDSILATFDFVVASIHSQIDMDEEAATERICRALANPFTTMLGHPTARLLLKRKGYSLLWPKVIETAAKHGVVIELNANPRRLDIDWRLLPDCFEAGVRTSINPDAHSVAGIDDMHYGVQVARKAGTTSDRVLNCLELPEIVRYFESRRP